MKKKEIVILVGMMVLVGILYLVSRYFIQVSKIYVVVKHKDDDVLTVDITKDGEYWITGSYGKLMLEVKDSKWRITNEDCPNHICSSIGWINTDSYFPIICLPNEVSVTLKDAYEK